MNFNIFIKILKTKFAFFDIYSKIRKISFFYFYKNLKNGIKTSIKHKFYGKIKFSALKEMHRTFVFNICTPKNLLDIIRIQIILLRWLYDFIKYFLTEYLHVLRCQLVAEKHAHYSIKVIVIDLFIFIYIEDSEINYN